MSSTAAGNAVAAPSSSNATALMIRHTPIVRRPRPAPNNDADVVAVVSGALVAVISVRSRSGSVPTPDTGPAGNVGFPRMTAGSLVGAASRRWSRTGPIALALVVALTCA